MTSPFVSCLVVIPTTGTTNLRDAVNSVVNQTYPHVECLVVIDGPEYHDLANNIVEEISCHKVKTMTLPWNVGGNGWYGHRTYAAVSYLFDHNYIAYLDQDNWFLPNHIETMIATLEDNNWDWCHSLRKIYDVDDKYICDDNCESLGRWPIYLSNQHHLVDTSTYLIKKEVILNLAPAWYSGWGGDRRFYAAISHHVPNYGCTKQPTVCYRLDGNPGSVTADFFIQGNEVMRQRHPLGFPWTM